MKLIKHPNILNLFEVMASKTKIYLVLEYVDGGKLFNKIAKYGRLKENKARRYFEQLINAVDYCHSRGVYHRDLKPENLLLDSFGVLKVLDFGLSAFSQQIQNDIVDRKFLENNLSTSTHLFQLKPYNFILGSGTQRRLTIVSIEDESGESSTSTHQ